MRADARRNEQALIAAARTVFAEQGVDAPSKAIADAAGLGVGTLYRRFPSRADLVAAVFRDAVDACADAAPGLAAAHAPDDAIEGWLLRFTEFLATKRGLAAALHSGDPAFDALPGYFADRLEPALEGLLATAAQAGLVRDDVEPGELIAAVVGLNQGTGELTRTRRMVAILVDGLRHGAQPSG